MFFESGALVVDALLAAFMLLAAALWTAYVAKGQMSGSTSTAASIGWVSHELA